MIFIQIETPVNNTAKVSTINYTPENLTAEEISKGILLQELPVEDKAQVTQPYFNLLTNTIFYVPKQRPIEEEVVQLKHQLDIAEATVLANQTEVVQLRTEKEVLLQTIAEKEQIISEKDSILQEKESIIMQGMTIEK